MRIIDYEKRRRSLENQRQTFLDAEPFSHIVIDDFLEEEAANALLAEFEQQRDWSHYNHFNERKMGLPEFSALGTRTQAIVHELSSEAFLQYLVDLSGIDGLLADPDLDGGGLHQIERGGYLNVHADFQSHTTRPMWSRQLNLLLYLNNDWQDDWEGDLELWDAEVSRAVKRVKPIFNRCIVFHTTAASMHGHPVPLACPPGQSRKSLALYYFRDERRTQKLVPTHYTARPSDSRGKHFFVAADRWLVHAYSILKRHTPVGDRLASRILKRFSR